MRVGVGLLASSWLRFGAGAERHAISKADAFLDASPQLADLAQTIAAPCPSRLFRKPPTVLQVLCGDNIYKKTLVPNITSIKGGNLRVSLWNDETVKTTSIVDAPLEAFFKKTDDKHFETVLTAERPILPAASVLCLAANTGLYTLCTLVSDPIVVPIVVIPCVGIMAALTVAGIMADWSVYRNYYCERPSAQKVNLGFLLGLYGPEHVHEHILKQAKEIQG